MPEETPTPPPETPPPHRPGQHVGTAFSGETTGSGTNIPTGEETVMMGPGASASVQVIGDFEVISKLGQGGMGAVYRARQRSLDRQVALKILPSTLEADADFVSRFQREARVAASLNHANLVKVYSSGAADGTHFIAMELIEGETLGDWLKRGPLPPLEALRICGDVARALEHGWNRAQLIHRDIKPGNIFLSVHGDVKVGDLGLAKTMSGDTTGLTHTGTAMGTPHYISPEQARGDKDLDFRADIYSLGCTLFQMLTGRTPYEGRDPMNVMYQHINSPPPAILKVLPGCPIPLARLVGKMLKKIKRERHVSYEELLANIESVAALFAPTGSVLESALPPDPDSTQLATPGHTPRSATPVTAPVVAPTKPSAPKSKAPLYGGLAAGVVVLGIVAFLVWPKQEKLSKAELVAKQREAEEKANIGTPIAATKDAPFVNTLGMKFVPVPITGGPTSGQRVLFSIWETRVQDYAAFAKATQRKWANPPAEYGATHPAVSVSWEDATAFCAWLTAQERQTGKLRATESYRLPRDHEWSCAVGIGEREDATKSPMAKNNGMTGVYPWGANYPPPPKTGNYLGLERADNPPIDQAELERIGLRDDFPRSAPVGSFRSNALGLFDLGGNVWEWCADWAEPEPQRRILRGASFENIVPPSLLLSSRRSDSYGPTASHHNIGFRIVLAPAAASTGQVAAEPWRDWLAPIGGKLPEEFEQAGDQVRVIKDGGRYWGNLRDGGIRLVWKPTPDSNPILSVRVADTGSYRLIFGETIALQEYPRDAAAGAIRTLAKWPLPAGFDASREHTLELRAVGDQLSARLDGVLLGSGRAETIRPGALGFSAKPGTVFRKVEFLIGVGASAGTPPTAEAWEDVLSDPAKLEIRGNAERTADGLQLAPQSFLWVRKTKQMRDGAIRARTVLDSGSRLQLSVRFDQPGSYSAYVENATTLRLLRWDEVAKQSTTLGNFAIAPALIPGETYELELRVVGQTLTTAVNGKVVGSATDSNFSAGLSRATAIHSKPALLKSLEILDLDTPASASALPAVTGWQDAMPIARESFLKSGAGKEENGWLVASKHGPNITLDPGSRKDYAIRGRYRSRVGLVLRASTPGYYGVHFRPDRSDRSEIRAFLPGAERVLAESPIPGGDEHDFLIVIRGDTISVWVDGSPAGSAQDDSIVEGKTRFDLFTTGSAVRDLAIADLSPATPATSQPWLDVLAAWWAGEKVNEDFRKLSQGHTKAERDGILALPKRQIGPDQVARAVFRLEGSPYLQLILRRTISGKETSHYKANLVPSEGKLRIALNAPEFTGDRVLQDVPLPAGFDAAARHTLEFRIQGEVLTAILDGKTLYTGKATRITQGYPALVARTGAIIEKFEVLDLAASAGASTPAPLASSAPAVPVVGVPSLEPGAIRLWDSPDKLPTGRPGIQWKDDAFYISSTTAVVEAGKTPLRARDSLLRFALRTNPTAQWASIVVRDAGTPKTPRLYSLRLSPKDKLIEFWSGNGEPEQRKLQTWPFPRAYGDDEWMRVEFRTVGDLFTVTVDGAVVGTVRDATVTGPGLMHFGSKLACYFRDIEYVPLDGAPATPTAEILTFDGHRYQLLAEPLTWAAAKARAEAMGGHLATINSPQESSFVRDRIVPRLSALSDKPSARRLLLGGRRESAGAAWQWITGEPFDSKLWVGEPTVNPPAGTQYLVWDFGGKRWDTVSDNWAPFPLIEWDSAEIPPATSAPSSTSPAAATREAPFVNGLGMKFVPVPIIGGPTEGKRVLCSVWETRVHDYAAFATETKREWPQPGFAQGPTHPAVMAHWDDAQAFAKWLTERERKAGRLGADEVYRLPTDHEWSCAVGIGRREVATKLPDEKDGVLNDALPWGQLWPPPPGVGNLAGEELQPVLAAGKHGNIKTVLVGYRDEIVETAPVGQFPANPLGLLDLGGNAREWCADWLDAAQKYRVLRGGSWNSGNLEQLLSSNRSRGLPDARNNDLGFRVVLAPVP